MKIIKMVELVGAFASNKDVAKDVRINRIIPALQKGENVILDFEGINGATQSFIHALISDIMRKFGADVLDRMSFKTCNKNVQEIIKIVTRYMQIGLAEEE